MRIMIASMPPITRKSMAYNTYMMPSFFGSTVTTQLCNTSSQVPSASAAATSVAPRPPGTGMLDPAISAPLSRERLLLQGIQVGCDLVHLVCRQVHGRHQRSLFEQVRIYDPPFQVFRCVICGSGGNGLPARQMRQIRPKLPTCGCACNRMAIHACLRFKLAPASRNRWILHARLLLLLHPCGKL